MELGTVAQFASLFLGVCSLIAGYLIHELRAIRRDVKKNASYIFTMSKKLHKAVPEYENNIGD